MKPYKKIALENSPKKGRQKSKPFTKAVKVTVNKHNSMTHKQETNREQNRLS